MKAKKVGIVGRNQYCSVVEYEYRGETYCVEYSNCWTYCTTPPKIQHMDAQEKIDRQIANESEPKTDEPIDWDEIWKLYGWD